MMPKMEISHKSEIKINSESQDTIQRETKMEFSFTKAWKLDRKSDKKYGRKEQSAIDPYIRTFKYQSSSSFIYSSAFFISSILRVLTSFTGSGFSYSSASSLMAFFYIFLAYFFLAVSSPCFQLNYSLSMMYFFFNCLYSPNKNSFMASKLSPCICTVPVSITEQETANFLLHFFERSLQSIS